MNQAGLGGGLSGINRGGHALCTVRVRVFVTAICAANSRMSKAGVVVFEW